MRASIAAEAAGVPSVSLVCEGFVGQGTATGKGLGYDALALAILDGHVDAQSVDEMLERFCATVVDQVIAGLTAAGTINRVEPPIEPARRDVVAAGTIDEINELFVDNGWSDGLPIIPPTVDRVERFLVQSGTGRDAEEVIGMARPAGRQITVWSVAVNAVMAGMRPEQLRVALALAEIMADPGYGVEHSGNTTGADALIIFNGPLAAELGFNAGQGVLRDGFQANTSVGRWLRLYLRNGCGFLPGEHDKATFGNSFRVVLAEDEDALVDLGWPPLSSDFGFERGDNVVTMVRMNSGNIVGSVFGSTPDEILPYLADGLARTAAWDLTHVYGLGEGAFRPMLILSPILANTFAAAGWSRDDLKAALFEQARIPAQKFERYIGEWSNLTPGRRTLHDIVNMGKLPKAFGESADPDRLVPIVIDPSRFLIAVAGDPYRTNAYAFSSDGPHGYPTAKRIR